MSIVKILVVQIVRFFLPKVFLTYPASLCAFGIVVSFFVLASSVGGNEKPILNTFLHFFPEGSLSTADFLAGFIFVTTTIGAVLEVVERIWKTELSKPIWQISLWGCLFSFLNYLALFWDSLTILTAIVLLFAHGAALANVLIYLFLEKTLLILTKASANNLSGRDDFMN